MIKKISLAFMSTILLVMTFLPLQGIASTKDSIITSAKKHLGVPYLFGGTTPSGFDCSGFIGYVFRENGISLPRTASEQYRAGQPVSRAALEKGDLVFFETYKSGPSHSGIYLGNGEFISAKSSRGIAIASVNDPFYWGPRFIGARRVLEEQPEQKTLATLPPGNYHDVPQGHFAYNEIRALGEQGIINGFDHSIFKPNTSLTRAEAATILARATGLTANSSSSNFSDISQNHWAAGHINATVEAGYFKGFEDGTFKPNAILTREQVAAIISRAFDLSDQETELSFQDISESNWSYSYIQRLVSSGITVGFKDNTYRPKANITRAEYALFLHRALNNMN